MISQFRLLEKWLWRGFFQLFTALLTLELSRSTAPGQSDVHKSLKLYRIVAGCSLLGCSGMYMLCGILCFGRQKAKGRSFPSLSTWLWYTLLYIHWLDSKKIAVYILWCTFMYTATHVQNKLSHSHRLSSLDTEYTTWSQYKVCC